MGTSANFGVKIVEAFQRVDQLLVCPFGRVGVLRVWLLLRLVLLLFLRRQWDGDVYGRLRHGERGRMEDFCVSGGDANVCGVERGLG